MLKVIVFEVATRTPSIGPEKYTSDTSIAFAFDNRPHRVEENRDLFKIFQLGNQSTGPTLDSVSFLSSARFYPLQAADLIAWEHYQFARDYLNKGIRTPERKQFVRLIASRRVSMKVLTRDAIKNMLDKWGNEELTALAAKAMDMMKKS